MRRAGQARPGDAARHPDSTREPSSSHAQRRSASTASEFGAVVADYVQEVSSCICSLYPFACRGCLHPCVCTQRRSVDDPLWRALPFTRVPAVVVIGRFGGCQPTRWEYHELPAETNATCLDGSPYGFYFGESNSMLRMWPRTMLHNESWVLIFEGGGWCISPEDCALRAETKLGSSTSWSRGSNISIGGLVNRCCFCTKFCRFKRVYLKSCDGHLFAGNAQIGVPPSQAGGHTTTPLRSAGQLIVRSVLDELIRHHGLARARNVLVGGCSAGGLSALLNAASIRDQLRAAGARLDRFKVVSLAGILFEPPRPLLQAPSERALGQSSTPTLLTPFEEQIRSVAQLGQLALPAQCIAVMPSGEAWRCLLGISLLEALPSDLPAFVYQSRLDLWQTNCVLSAGRSRYFGLNCSSGSWRACLGWAHPLRATSRCSTDQWKVLRTYEEVNDAALLQSAALRRQGYGSFVHSCYDHCPSGYGLIHTGAALLPGSLVNDSINFREALHLWFKDMPSDAVPAWNHTHAGCWNGLVSSKVPGKSAPPYCRRPECSMPDKLHHDDTRRLKAIIQQRGWPFQLA